MIWKIRRVLRKIKNLFIWLPVIWRDEQWDNSYIYILLQKKLSLMEEYFRTKGISVDAKNDAKKIRTCKLLLERLSKDDYNSMLDLEYHQNNFDDFIWALNEKKKTITCHTISWLGDCWMGYENYMAEQDLDYLFKLLKKNIRCWWD